MRSLGAWVLLVVVAASLGMVAARYVKPRIAQQADDGWSDGGLDSATPGGDGWARPAGASARSADLRRQTRSTVWEGFWGPERLPDAVFRHRTGTGRILFEQIHTAVSSGHVNARDLNRPEGSFLHDDQKGWMRFNGSSFVPVGERELPEGLERPTSHAADDHIDQAASSGKGDS